MANLLDAIRQNSAPQTPGMGDQSLEVARLLRAKSGKSVAAPAIGASSLAEAAATGQAQQQIQNQVMPQATIQQAGQQAQQAAQEQSQQIQQAGQAQQKRELSLQDKLKTEALLNDFEQNRGKLNLEKNRAQTQQFAQNLRLSNQKYIDDLQSRGARARLDDAATFSEELNKQIFGDSEELLRKQIGDREILDASDREFKKAIGQMTIDQARLIFDQEKAAARERAPYEAIGNIATAGASGASMMSGTPSSAPASAAPSGGGGGGSASAPAVQTGGAGY